MSASQIDIRQLVDEMNRMPDRPTLKRNTDGTFHDISGPQHDVTAKISRAHIESFDFMLDEGVNLGIRYVRPLEMMVKGRRLQVSVSEVSVSKPKGGKGTTDPFFPSQARMGQTSYKGLLNVGFKVQLGEQTELMKERVGEIPIMLKSKSCNLRGLTQSQMVARKEDANDIGGYFIVNGIERVIRMLTAQRRNYPMGQKNKAFLSIGKLFSEYGVSMRCVRPDQQNVNMAIHYLTNGTARLQIYDDRQPLNFPIALVLKILVDESDRYIFNQMIKGKEGDSYYASCCVNMIQMVSSFESRESQDDLKRKLGAQLRSRDRDHRRFPEWISDQEVCDRVFRASVAPHLTNDLDKFNLLIFMLKKLFAIAKGQAAIESLDNPMFHETYLSGHIYFGLLMERIEMFLASQFDVINRKLTLHENSINNSDSLMQLVTSCLRSRMDGIVRPLVSLVATGNLICRSGLGLKQTNGLSVVAEKINHWRFISTFRAVHRGSFFEKMRTTSCRKLYPESWGFLCPVHTPDGSPCGLLNHLAETAIVTNWRPTTSGVMKYLRSLGMEELDSPLLLDNSQLIHVILDGKVIGFLSSKEEGDKLATHLRNAKAAAMTDIPNTLEIGFIPPTKAATQFPGLFIFSTPARIMRPVMNLAVGKVELIGTFEQPYMEICIIGEEAHALTTHQEIRQTSMLSIIAGQIPFPDFNQSPRNMYCCQMGKQTMGYPSHTLKYRSDHKMFEISSPQAPLVRPAVHDHYNLDDYPMGTNGIVAVISYTGYDMEDALILNKASVDRGFCHGAIIKTVIVDLTELSGDAKGGIVFQFARLDKDAKGRVLARYLDEDGLPIIGRTVRDGEPLCSYIDTNTNSIVVKDYKESEPGHVVDVKLLGSETGNQPLQKVAIKLFLRRVPSIGDKFANRHGQKGIVSFLWPQESMPFTESGMTPDIIFNPHGYPSRMTIGMMIESMAGVTASALGTVHDATPFTFSEENPASEYYGKLLESVGFNYYGTERMFSGVDGRMLKADIFVGCLYYIRLRHMVGDKYQVRAEGPVDQVTHQPVKGRKRAGGMRFGEMERDSLLSHGTSFLIQDRLFNCSDRTTANVCQKCSSLISPMLFRTVEDDEMMAPGYLTCRVCETSDYIQQVHLPHVLKYLVSELASVNIKCNFAVK